MFEWLFHSQASQKLKRDEIKADAENEVMRMREKSEALFKTLEAEIRRHVEEKH